MERCKEQGLTVRGTERKRKNFKGAQKVCRECGVVLVEEQNIFSTMFRHREYICRECNTKRNQLYYINVRFSRMAYDKKRKGIVEESKCSAEDCDAPWFILQPHHLPNGEMEIMCPNHHAIWHWLNGKVVRKKGNYRRWIDVSS